MICSTCWCYIDDFYQFQLSILATDSTLHENISHQVTHPSKRKRNVDKENISFNKGIEMTWYGTYAQPMTLITPETSPQSSKTKKIKREPKKKKKETSSCTKTAIQPIQTVYNKPIEPEYTRPIQPSYAKPIEPLYTEPIPQTFASFPQSTSYYTEPAQLTPEYDPHSVILSPNDTYYQDINLSEDVLNHIPYTNSAQPCANKEDDFGDSFSKFIEAIDLQYTPFEYLDSTNDSDFANESQVNDIQQLISYLEETRFVSTTTPDTSEKNVDPVKQSLSIDPVRTNTNDTVSKDKRKTSKKSHNKVKKQQKEKENLYNLKTKKGTDFHEFRNSINNFKYSLVH